MFAVTTFAAGALAQDRPAPPDQVPPNAAQPQAGDEQGQPADDGQVTVQARAQQVDPQEDDQDQQNSEPPADPNQPVQGAPSTGVARASFVHGEVSMQRGDSGDNAQVTLNTPLVPGDTVFTGDKARTELQLDFANVVRLAAQTQVKIANLTRNQIQL